MAVDDTKLLTKVNLNGTELVISDAEARQQIAEGAAALYETNKRLDNTDTAAANLAFRVGSVESEVNSLITAKYDAQSSTLSLTSKS